MSAVRAASAALALAWLACAGSHAGPRLDFDPKGWHEIATVDFAVAGNTPRDTLEALFWELAHFDALVEKVTTARLERPSVPVRLYVFRTAEEAEVFTGWAAGILIPTLSGYFAILGVDAADFRTRRILFHEYAHYVLRSRRRVAYPRWYDEGLSEFLATARFRDDAVIVGVAPSDRLATLTRTGLLPLADLFGATDRSRREVSAFYATAWAVVHYLNVSSARRERLERFATRLTRGEPWRAAYRASFEESLAELESAVAAHVARMQRGARLDYHLRADSLRVLRVWTDEPLPPAEIDYQLGTIARLLVEDSEEPEHLELARSAFARALEHDPTHARARGALAWCIASDGDVDVALPLAEAAEREAPSDAIVALEVARVRALGGAAEAEAALSALDRAVELGPDLAEAHAERGRFLARAGRTRRAIGDLERARELGAWSPPLDLDLARQYLAVHETARAVELLVRVASDAHGGETSREARELLHAAAETTRPAGH